MTENEKLFRQEIELVTDQNRNLISKLTEAREIISELSAKLRNSEFSCCGTVDDPSTSHECDGAYGYWKYCPKCEGKGFIFSKVRKDD